MKRKKIICMLCAVGMTATLFTGCGFLDALDKVEGGIDQAVEAVDQLERIEDKATSIFDE